MRTESIEFERLGASRLFLDYISDNNKVHHFFDAGAFDELESWKKKLTQLQTFEDREALVENLTRFNQPFEPSDETIKNIQKLHSENSFTVVTGQQLTLFGGPLYTFLKTITTIKTAAYLSETLNVDIIPVFWLADEDHDFDEMATISLPVYDELKSITAEKETEHSFAAGKLNITESVEQALIELMDALPDTEFLPEIRNVMERCWANGTSWRTAFGKMMMHFFGKYGLVLIGSDDAHFKKSAIPVLVDAIEQKDELYATLQKASTDLEDGYHAQVKVGDSNLFYHHPEKGRLKIHLNDGRWEAGDEWSLNSEDIIIKIKEQPELFSPNVFLRPVIQQKILPNLAYIGGPAEIAYHAQMRDVFRLMNTEMPIILPRLSATIVEPAIERLFTELPFPVESYNMRIEDLEKAFIEQSQHDDTTAFFNEWKEDINTLFGERLTYLTERDASLKGAVLGVQSRTEKELEKLEQKLNRSVKNQESVQLKRLAKVQHAFYPDGNPQERTYAWLYFMAKYGTKQMMGVFDSMPYSLQMLKKHHLVFVKSE